MHTLKKRRRACGSLEIRRFALRLLPFPYTNTEHGGTRVCLPPDCSDFVTSYSICLQAENPLVST